MVAGPGGVVGVQDLPAMFRLPNLSTAAVAEPIDPAMADKLGDIAERAMRQAIEKHAGNVSAAARSLGISRSTLYRRLT